MHFWFRCSRTPYHHPKTRFVAGFIGSPGMNFFPVHVGDDVVHLDNGQALEIPEARRRQYARHRNTMMLLGMRPEHLTEAPRPGSALMTVAVDVVEPMGMETMVHFRLPAAKGAMGARYSGAGFPRRSIPRGSCRKHRRLRAS